MQASKLIKEIFKKSLKITFKKLGIEVKRITKPLPFANYKTLDKAPGKNFNERFREVISDPLNLLIERCPHAGYCDKNERVFLHNGISVPFSGKYSYYNKFSEILILNRGVHEPLEEYCFQETIKKLLLEKEESPLMLELGSYWAHYSMWLKLKIPNAKCFLVEPDPLRLKSGENNFVDNGFKGIFINEFVSDDCFKVDDFMSSNNISSLDILHSDIQGYEYQMLKNSENSFKDDKFKYIFISTHSEELHNNCIDLISKHNYRIEASSGFDDHTTSFDGFIFASNVKLNPVLKNLNEMGRKDIAQSKPKALLSYLTNILDIN